MAVRKKRRFGRLGNQTETPNNEPKETKIELPSIVRATLAQIPDDLPISQIKEKDVALRTLVKELRAKLLTKSWVADLSENATMGEVKNVLESLSKDTQVKLLNTYTDLRHGLNEEDKFEKCLGTIQRHYKAFAVLLVFVIIVFWVILSSIFGDGVSGDVFAEILKLFTTFLGGNNDDLRIP